MFTRKFKIVVLVSLISVMSLTYAGCSGLDFSLKTVLQNFRVIVAHLSQNWRASGSTPRTGTESSVSELRIGTVTTDFNFGLDEINTAAIQPDGKIVAAGVSSGRFGLVRYNPTGSLDATFGTGGKVTTSFLNTNQGITALVIQPDGKIVVVGLVQADNVGEMRFNRYDFGLARYNADGSLDAAFGTGGKVITDIAPNKADVAMALALQPDGKIVVAGFNGAPVTPRMPSDFVIVRYNSNGSLDPAFGTGGIVITNLNNEVDFASSLVIQPDGKMVVGGWTYNRNNSSYDFALARYDSNGNLDNGFGSGGIVVTDFGSMPNDVRDDFITSMVLLPDGKILAAGTGEPNRNTTSSDFVIARFNSNGSLDTTFGTNGKVSTDFNGAIDCATSIALQPDGKFVVAGVANGLLINELLPNWRISNNIFFIHSPTLSDFAAPVITRTARSTRVSARAAKV